MVWLLVPLLALGVWNFARGQGWHYSRFGWRLAADDGRESMARDYLATRDVRGMTLDELRADLGDESSFREHWTYFVGDYEPVFVGGWTVPAYYRRPTLDLKFNRRGVLRSLDPGSLWDGPIAAFDAKTWRATAGAERAPMARDLVERQLFVGASRDDLQPLLGDPDSAEIRLEYLVREGVSDGAYLEVRLGLDRRVVDARVTSEGD